MLGPHAGPFFGQTAQALRPQIASMLQKAPNESVEHISEKQCNVHHTILQCCKASVVVAPHFPPSVFQDVKHFQSNLP